MTTKARVLIALILLAVSFTFGRYSVDVKTEESSKVTDTKQIDREKHVKTVVVVNELPDGTKHTETTTTNDTTTKIDASTTTTDVKSITPVKRSTLNVSLLAGTNLNEPFKPTYGASITKEVLGPITVGVWGLTTGTAGISLGVDF